MSKLVIDIENMQAGVLNKLAKTLYDEKVLKEPTIESLILSTIDILEKEYSSNPSSVIMYYKKRVDR